MQLCCPFKSELGACLLNKDSILKSIFWQNECGSGICKWCCVRTCCQLLLCYSLYNPARRCCFVAHICRLSGPCPDRAWGSLPWARHSPLAVSTPSLLLLASYSGCLSCPPACLVFRLIAWPWLWKMHPPEPLPCVHLVCWTTILFWLLVTICLSHAFVYLQHPFGPMDDLLTLPFGSACPFGF